MKIKVPASITFNRHIRKMRYRWKSDKSKVSTYFPEQKRIVLRIASSGIGTKPNKLDKQNRQVDVLFKKINKKWNVEIKRMNRKSLTLHCRPYSKSVHTYIQITLNRKIPNKLKEYLERNIKTKSFTIPIIAEIDLNEWKDIDLKPWDFLYHTEIYAKELMECALKMGFTIDYVSKGRNYDLQLIGPKDKRFIIAISSHNAKTDTRSKQHRISKALLDIAKMIPMLSENKHFIPVVITQPFDFEKSWSFTSDGYINFYKKHFNINFIATEFDGDWKKKVLNELIKIELKTGR